VFFDARRPRPICHFALADRRSRGGKDGTVMSRFFEIVPDGVAKVGFYTRVQLRPFRYRGLVTVAVSHNIAAFQVRGAGAQRLFAVWYAADGHVIKRVGDWGMANTPVHRTPSAKRTVTVPITSFQDPTPLSRSLRDARVPAMVQLLPRGEDCVAPPSFTPVPTSSLPTFDTAKNPRANPPIDFGVARKGQTTLILRYIPPNATLVIESQAQSVNLAAAWPANKKGASLEPQHGRGIYVVWAEGTAHPCRAVRASRR
jgi:hypothetical protein